MQDYYNKNTLSDIDAFISIVVGKNGAGKEVYFRSLIMKHICFESISCRRLQYVQASNSWVCLATCSDLKHVDTCMNCKFAKLRVKEDKIRKDKNGRILRLAQDSII